MSTRVFQVTIAVPRWRTRVGVAMVRLAIVLHPVLPALAFAIARRACALTQRGVEVIR